ncbi:MAG: transcriptional regulator [Gallicola sp.]|nr:transcriptional regulator [Gallicola sp.]
MRRIKTSTFNYIKEILNDYPKIEEYIKKRKEELKHPYRPDDVNADIKADYSKASMDNYLITLEQDRRLNCLERNRRIIKKLLDESDHDTRTIINELYTKRFPSYTIPGVVNNNLIKCGKSSAYKLRDNFFREVAKELDLEV